MARLLLIVVALCGSAFAGTTDPQHEDARYVEYGRRFSTFTLEVQAARDGGAVGNGTGVAIADRWVLTAAHVVHKSAHVAVVSGTSRWRVRRVHVSPRFRVEVMGHNDIALLHTEPLQLAEYAPLADGSEKPGDEVDVVGYGLTGRLTTGWERSDGKLRAGTNTLARSEDGCWVCVGEAGSSPLELLTAPGDSGGPLLAKGLVVGIHSTVQRYGKGPVKSVNGQESYHTRVADHLPWIADVMGKP
jgi:secreted trypsin-like serine protease